MIYDKFWAANWASISAPLLSEAWSFENPYRVQFSAMAPTRVDPTTSLELTSVARVTLTSPGAVLRSLASFSTSMSLPAGLGSSPAEVSELRIDGQNESRHDKGKKKKVGLHSWIAIDINGRTESMEVDKRAIKKRTSIPTRDLRVLGPLFSASAAILRKPTPSTPFKASRPLQSNLPLDPKDNPTDN